MNYKPVIAGNQSNGNAGTKACDDACKARRETIPGKDYILLPLWPADPLLSQNSKSSPDAGFKPSGDNGKKVIEEPRKDGGDPSNKNNSVDSTNNINTASDGNNTNKVNTVSSTVNTAGIEVNAVSSNTSIELPNDPNMPELKDIVYSDDYENVGAEADMNNLNTFMPVSPIPTTRIHKDHPLEQIIGYLNPTPQTRRMTKNLEKHEEPKKVIHALKDPSWIEAMQDELLQFKLQKVWTLVDLPNGKRAIGTKWVFRNKKDERGIVIKNKARIEAIRLFLAYASFKDFVLYQMDVKSAFLKCLQLKQKEDGIFISQDKLISWQCKKQTVVANSITKAEYVAALSCCGQVLWIQNQLLNYGYNFMQTKIHIDNKSTICIVKNPVFYSKTKHIEIMHHFIRDSYEKKLIQMIKIHTNKNVVDLLIKAFDVSRFQYLITSIGMLNL
ncbi:putative ribonuclease H-like domain-containing protein [Tanacetum coccineum]